MGLHLCYDLGAEHAADAAMVLAELHRFARGLPFAEVGPVLDHVHGDSAMFGATWTLPLDDEGNVRERDWESPRGTSLRCVTVQPLAWAGFRVHPGRGCETASFGLARHPSSVSHDGRAVPIDLGDSWRWHGVCKTQHASSVSWEHFMTVHGSLVSMLDHAATLGILTEVRDDTGFWDTRDWETAVEETQRMNEVVQRVGRALQRALDDTAEPD